MVIHDIWYATEKRARSATKLMVYDDTGRIVSSGGKLEFQGSLYHITLDSIKSISLASQRWNWVAWIIMFLVMIPSAFAGYVLLEKLFGLGKHFFIFCVACVILSFLIGVCPDTWIKIDHAGPEGKTVASYFACAGWRGRFGRTKKLFHQLCSMALAEKPS